MENPGRATTVALPKAELHVHLEGTLEPELLVALARRNDVAIPWTSADQLRAAYEFDDLAGFLALYYEGCRVLTTRADLHDLTSAYLRRAHDDGVVHAEMFLGPQSFTDRLPMADVLGGVFDAVEQAQAELGISAGLLVSAHRHRSEEDAFELLRAVGPWRDRILGFGLGGPELGNPPAKFARYFAELTRQGFPVVAHAGEEAPASYVREAVEVLGVHRIDHGTSIARDETLMREVAAAGIPLTVCPLSNVRLKGVPSLAAHPLPRMLEAGLTVTLNSDDPPYFGGYLVDNYEACRETFGWSDAQVSELAAAGLRAAFLPPGRAAELSAAARRPAAPLN